MSNPPSPAKEVSSSPLPVTNDDNESEQKLLSPKKEIEDGLKTTLPQTLSSSDEKSDKNGPKIDSESNLCSTQSDVVRLDSSDGKIADVTVKSEKNETIQLDEVKLEHQSPLLEKRLRANQERKVAPKAKKFDLVGSILSLSQNKKMTIARLGDRRRNPIVGRSMPGCSESSQPKDGNGSGGIEADGQSKYDPFDANRSSASTTGNYETCLADFLRNFSRSSGPIDLDKLRLMSYYEIRSDEEAEAVKKIIDALSDSLVSYETSILPPDITEMVKDSICK
ncbi:uncharacterized protein LOC141858234 [Brevipalpus obovatus]|uniref:uncharacterized protein LOC141858234 n=1 Tax=Brevipalpus obovatus TaxID=246614 RepID=UPI003D9E705D